MRHKYRSRRSARRLARKSRRNFLITIILIGIFSYATLNWVLPSFIGGVGVIKNIIKPPQTVTPKSSQNASLAPPVLKKTYEYKKYSQIDIQGFGTPDSRVKLYIDDESKQTADVSNDGSFIFKNVDLSLGTNNIYGITVDEEQKESLPSKTIKLIFNSEKPPLDISSPGDNTVIAGGEKKVTVSGKTNSGIRVFVNNSQVIVDKDGNFRSDIAINEGDNTISIKAVDSASNSTEVERSVKYNP